MYSRTLVGVQSLLAIIVLPELFWGKAVPLFLSTEVSDHEG